MFPADLNPDRLYLFVLGPGVGESIIVRIPPDSWLVVDSYRHNGRPAASYVLERYHATWSVLVLTHPHADHHAGMDQLLASNPGGIVGCVHPRADDLSMEELPLDPMRHLGQGALPVYDAIRQRWDRLPETRWETYRHEERGVGDAKLTALHPVRPLIDSDWARNPNELSSAVLLHWKQLTLLLGADVVNRCWREIAHEFPGLHQHHGLKVPHHGSVGAIHESYVKGDPARCWVITPYRNSRLPRSQDGDGLDLMLRCVSEVQVTALPYRHDCENETPCVTTRESMLDKTRPRPMPEMVLPGGRHGTVATTETRVDRHVVVEFDRQGLVKGLFHGPGSVRIVRTDGKTPPLTNGASH